MSMPLTWERAVKTVGYVVAPATMLSEPVVAQEMRLMADRGHRIVPILVTDESAPAVGGDAAPLGPTGRIGTAAAWRTLARTLPRWPRALAFVRAQRGLARRSLLLDGARMARVARAAGCDHLHAHLGRPGAYPAIVAARLNAITVSLVAQGAPAASAGDDLAAGLRHADLAIAPSRALADRLRASAADATIALVPCGIDPSDFAPRPADQPDNGRWLYTGPLDGASGVEDLLDALWLLGPVATLALDIAGAGTRTEALMARAVSLGLAYRVRFLGARDDAWLRTAGPAYRGLVAPGGIADGEPCGPAALVLKQAMAMGLPVIAAEREGGPEIVDRSCGRTVPPGDPRALACALVDVDGLSPAARRGLGLAGRRRVGRLFDAARQGDQLSRLVQAV